MWCWRCSSELSQFVPKLLQIPKDKKSMHWVFNIIIGILLNNIKMENRGSCLSKLMKQDISPGYSCEWSAPVTITLMSPLYSNNPSMSENQLCSTCSSYYSCCCSTHIVFGYLSVCGSYQCIYMEDIKAVPQGPTSLQIWLTLDEWDTGREIIQYIN